MILLCCVLHFFFFFKQKTAYEMRISDWSSDVCSSDLGQRGRWNLSADQQRAVDPAEVDDDPRGWSAGGKRRNAGARADAARRDARLKIGRASCRERVCQYV